jgi:hypothetical protein
MSEPFRFCMRLSLQFVSHGKAHNALELWEKIKTVPESSLYHHTHRSLQGYQFLRPEPENDFAYWAEHVLGDSALGQALWRIDSRKYTFLGDLRTALADTVEPFVRPAEPQKKARPFYFVSTLDSSVTTPHAASTIKEMAETLIHVSPASLYMHLFESKLRLPPGENDFSLWLETECGDRALAEKVRGMDLAAKTLDEIRQDLIELFRSTETSQA